MLTIVEAQFSAGDQQRYVVPLAVVRGDDAEALATTMPSAMHAIETTYPAVPGRKVRRSDGIVYASAREAARANGADHANLSKHLARRTGFASVAGYTFEWVA